MKLTFAATATHPIARILMLDADSLDVEIAVTRLWIAMLLVTSAMLLLGCSLRDSRFEQARCAIEVNTDLSRKTSGMICWITVF
jgi:hypothetical protein